MLNVYKDIPLVVAIAHMTFQVSGVKKKKQKQEVIKVCLSSLIIHATDKRQCGNLIIKKILDNVEQA